jgi:multisubunit Na+/H+ antiporter MnhG subunit
MKTLAMILAMLLTTPILYAMLGQATKKIRLKDRARV